MYPKSLAFLIFSAGVVPLVLLTIISGIAVALSMSSPSALATANPQSEASPNASAGQVTTSTWQVRGNGGGGALVYAAISPHNSQEMYVTTDMSAVFHTTDFGQNWQVMPFSQLTGIYDADVRFTSDPNVLYAIHWYDYSWGVKRPVRSNDGGRSFQPLPAAPVPDYSARIFADPDSTERIVIGYETAVYFSNDGGTTYQLVVAANEDSWLRLSGIHWEGDAIYVAVSYGIYLSTDGGDSFAAQTIAGLPADEGLVNVAISREDEQLRFIATVAPKESIWPILPGGIEGVIPTVYRLDWDNGGWQQLSFSGEPLHVEMRPGNINTIFLAGATEDEDPGVWKSGDGGESWQLLLDVDGNANVATGWMGDNRPIEWGWDAKAFAFDIDPNNPDRMVISGNFIHTSEDGGETWQAVYVKEADLNAAGTPSLPKAYHGTGISPIPRSSERPLDSLGFCRSSHGWLYRYWRHGQRRWRRDVEKYA